MLDRLPELTGYLKICKDIIFPMVLDTDFEEMYKAGGRPPVSPRVLMCVTILQFLERLPDRQTIQNLLYRLDWKIAMGLEIDDPGFSYQLLSVWRGRLLEHDWARKIFDNIVEELKERGLVHKGGKQRIDSTHVLAELRELSRVELLTETLRLASIDLDKLNLQHPSDIEDLIRTYIDGIRLYQVGSEERKRILGQAGQDMLKLVNYINSNISKKAITKDIETLKIVFDQNFTIDKNTKEPVLIKVSTGKDHICSPHETQARFGSKHSNIGYKAQIVETAERDQINFIVDVFEEDNEETDHGKLEEALKRSEEKDLTPGRMYSDQGYISGKTIAEADKNGVEAYGPIENRDKGINDEFKYDPVNNQYTCPAGKTSMSSNKETNGTTIFRFSNKDCKDCPLRKQCRPKAKKKTSEGRMIRRSKYHDEIVARRELMKTEEFKDEIKNRNAIEGTISAMKRGYNFVKCRYRGKKKFRLQLFFTALAFNVKRLDLAYAD